jgi:hypothetical protein
MRRRQAVRVANASRGRRDVEMRLYERLDAAVDEAFWAEQMRQQVLPLTG